MKTKTLGTMLLCSSLAFNLVGKDINISGMDQDSINSIISQHENGNTEEYYPATQEEHHNLILGDKLLIVYDLEIPKFYNITGTINLSDNIPYDSSEINGTLKLLGENNISNISIYQNQELGSSIVINGKNINISNTYISKIGDIQYTRGIHCKPGTSSSIDNCIIDNLRTGITSTEKGVLGTNKVRNSKFYNCNSAFVSHGALDMGTSEDNGNNIIAYNNRVGTVINASQTPYQNNWTYDENGNQLTSENEILNEVDVISIGGYKLDSNKKDILVMPCNTNDVLNRPCSVDSWKMYE